MLETILAISGKPGLYKLVSRGNHNLIVESLDTQKKRFPAFAADKVISLADIVLENEPDNENWMNALVNMTKNLENDSYAHAVLLMYKAEAFDNLRAKDSHHNVYGLDRPGLVMARMVNAIPSRFRIVVYGISKDLKEISVRVFPCHLEKIL